MSVRTSSAVWDRSTHSGSELVMLLAIADFADDAGRAYPSIETLARKCRMSTRNVNYILHRLIASGELTVRLACGPRGTNVYLINDVSPSTRVQKPSEVKSSAGMKRASFTPEAGFPKPLKSTSSKPPLNHHEPSTLSGGDDDPSNFFEEFWLAYPKKASKGAALKAFMKLKVDPELLRRMLAAIDAQKQTDQWQKADGQYIPYPANWLSNHRWLDEIVGEAKTTQENKPAWALSAGFTNRFDAENAGCTERNHKQFANGKKRSKE